MPKHRLALFGEFGFEKGDGGRVVFATKRSAKLLALLALSRTGSMRRDDLCCLLWPDDFLDANRLRLRQELARLRKALDGLSSLLVADNEWVRLDRSSIETDLDVLSGRVADESDRLRILNEPFLPGWEDSWAVSERYEADSGRLKAAEQWAAEFLNRNEFDKALEVAKAGVAIDKTYEPIRLLAMRAYSGLGSLTNAVVEYRRYQKDVDQAGDPCAAEVSDFVPTKQSSAHVPAPVDSFYGRADALQKLQNLIDASDARLITIAGPGGIGKTRIAIEAAQGNEQIGFVGFAEAHPEEDPVAYLASHVLAGQGAGSTLAALRRLWQDRPTMLILDNLEHLVDPGRFLLELLGAVPSLRIVATSRRPMKVAGEYAVSLAPLSFDESLDLLTGHVACGWSRKELEPIAKLCGGLPLALRLAKARLRMLSPEELERELANTRAFSAPVADLPERQRDVAAMFDLAIDALEPEMRRLFRAMAEFPAGLTRELALRLGTKDTDLCLEQLLDAGLVWLEDDARPLRFRILEPIRQHVTAVPDLDARLAYVRAMANKARELGEGRKPNSVEDDRTLNQEAANFRLAMEYALELDKDALDGIFEKLWRHEISAGYAGQIAKFADRVLATEGILPNTRGAALMALAWNQVVRGNKQKAFEYIVPARQQYEAIGNESEAWSCQLLYVDLHRAIMPQEELLAAYQDVLDWVHANDPDSECTVRSWRGRMHLDEGRWSNAAEDLEFVFESAQESRLNGPLVLGGLALTLVYEALGLREKRDRCLKAVSEVLPKINVPQHTANYWYFRSLYAMSDSDPVAAENCAKQALKASWFTDGVHQLGPIRNSLARSIAKQGRFDEARELVSMNASAGCSRYWRIVTETLAVRAEIELKAGREAEAKRALAILEFVLNEKKPSMIFYEQRVIDGVRKRLGGAEPAIVTDAEIEAFIGSGMAAAV